MMKCCWFWLREEIGGVKVRKKVRVWIVGSCGCGFAAAKIKREAQDTKKQDRRRGKKMERGARTGTQEHMPMLMVRAIVNTNSRFDLRYKFRFLMVS
mmetsp:Transcript_1344/g.3385  ORF Transcript_1344/g.3385 Transcript_1344/m.3385 type:complete len:97 (+) Transcript_1344:968-1258(+)